MKNINIILFFLGFILVWSCDKEEDTTPPDELSDVSWLIGINRNAQDPFSINQDTNISFFDLSQGSVSHEWILENGNNFLKEGFGPNDSLPAFIDPDSGLSITRPKAHVLFRNQGINRVRLLNKFDEPVSYKFDGGTLDAVQEGNLWVIDTTFTFDVYEQIQPAFTVLKGNDVVLQVTEQDLPRLADASTWPTVEVEVGTGLTFVDNTTIGRPNQRSWRFPAGVPNQIGGEMATVEFFQLGTFTGNFVSSRVVPLPTRQQAKLIPLNVKVIPSSQPFLFSGALSEASDETISFQVTGEVLPFSGEEGNFIVNVTNAATGFDQDIPVQQAQVRTGNATFIELTLSAPIYNSDSITVSYNGNGAITSTDGRSLQAFMPEEVQLFFGNNILPGNGWASFETANPAINNAFAESFFIPGQNNRQFGDENPIYSRITDMAFDGTASMKYQLPASSPNIPSPVNLFGFSIASPSGIPAGLYRVSYQVFVDPATTISTFRMEFGNPIEATNNTIFDISSIERGQWVEVIGTLETGGSPFVTFDDPLPANYRTTLRIIPTDAGNDAVSGEQLIHFDDLSLVEVEPRP